MPYRRNFDQKRGDADRRRTDRRASRRRLRQAPLPHEDRRAGGDRRRGNRRGALRRASDTFYAKKRIFARRKKA
jgi:hypothetical protein